MEAQQATWAHSRPLTFAQSFTELDGQCSRLDGFDAFPTALSLVGVADDAV